MHYQEYLLTCMSEEAAELIQTIGKAQRFGLDDDFYNEAPLLAMRREFNDLLGVIELLLESIHNTYNIDYRAWVLPELIEAKKKKVEKYIEYSEKKGTIG